jgi:hypothetical protein
MTQRSLLDPCARGSGLSEIIFIFFCATRDEARSLLCDGCPEAMSWFVVLLKTTEMEEQ